MNNHTLAVVTCLFLLVIAASALAGTDQQSVILSKAVSTSPAIDGSLDDPCWKAAERSAGFTVLGQLSQEITGLWLRAEEKFTANAATAQVCHDDEYLYVAYRVPAPADVPAKAKTTEHDGPAWTDDCIELFIDPMQRMGFYQIVVNQIGTVADIISPPGSGSKDFKWKSHSNVAVQKAGPGFVVELAIPFSSLGQHSREPGSAWGINFTRQGPSGGGLSTWAPVGTSFGTPERFGLLVFESRAAYHQKQLDGLEAKLAEIATDKVPGMADGARRKMDSLRSAIRQQGEQASAWPQLRRSANEIDAIIRQIALRGRSCVLWQKDIWGPIEPDEKVPPGVKQLSKLDVLTAQNTRTAAGFLVSNLSDKHLMGRLLLPKPGKDGPLPEGTALLAEDHIEFRQAYYLERSSGQMFPEVLVELPASNLVTVPARTTVLIWMEIDTNGLDAGKYAREIQFYPSYSGFAKTSFGLNVDIAPIDLAAPKIKQFVYHLPNTQVWLPVAKDMARHGVNTVFFYPGFNFPGIKLGYPTFDDDGNIVSVDFSTLDTMIANMTEAGVPMDRMNILIEFGFNRSYYRNLRSMLTYDSPAWKKAFANTLIVFRDHLFEKGFTYEQIAFYPNDEPYGDPADPESGTHIAIKSSRFIKSVDPKFLTMANPGLDGEKAKHLDAYLREFDILEPYRPHINANPNLIRRLRASGREIWTYSILHRPNVATTYRNMSWLNARDGFTGLCAFYRYDTGAGDLFNSYDHNPGGNPRETADYCVVYSDWYPNFPTMAKSDQIRIIPGRRWEAWYQGTQDYRAFFICRELITKLKAAGKSTAMYEKTVRSAIDSAVNKPGADMDNARELLIRAAVEMQRSLPDSAEEAARCNSPKR